MSYPQDKAALLAQEALWWAELQADMDAEAAEDPALLDPEFDELSL